MCGIVGIIDADSSSKNNLLNKKTISRMNDLIAHRGPDDQGIFADEKQGVFLGSRRLSIIDLSRRGHQPMISPDRSIVLVYNGEIYNFRKIRKELKDSGHRFFSNTDTEVVIEAYREWGEKCLDKFRGMFAFALWDGRKKSLWLVRDRLGIKPLYFLKAGKYFAFASEAKAFLALKEKGWRPQLNERGLDLFLSFSHLPDSRVNMIRGVNKLPPGHFLVFKGGQARMKRYWRLEVDSRTAGLSFFQAMCRLEELLEESVRMRLIADVPLGVMLSGGIDSSLITALAQKSSSEKIKTFSVGFGHPLDEVKYAGIVARHLKTDHHQIMIDPRQIFDKLEEMVWYFDDLTTVESGLFSTYLIAGAVRRRGVKVVLLGEGADEILGGYSWFGLSKLPFSLLPDYLRAAGHGFAVTRKLFFRKGFWTAAGHINRAAKKFAKADSFQKVSAYELLNQLPNNILMKVDKATMARSVEARVPFLDHKVVEFAYSLAGDFKLKGRFFSMKGVKEKHLLRKIAAKYLPESIVYRKKRGFMLPIGTVMDENQDRLKNYLFDQKAFFKNYLGEKAVRNLLVKKENRLLETEREWLAWRVFIFEVWARQYLGGKN